MIFKKNILHFYRLSLFVCLVCIEYLATTSRHLGINEQFSDKTNHFLAFFVLYILLSLSYEKLSTLKAFALLLLFGLQIEIVQHFLPARHFSLLDVVADMVGICIGIVSFYIFKKIRKNP